MCAETSRYCRFLFYVVDVDATDEIDFPQFVMLISLLRCSISEMSIESKQDVPYDDTGQIKIDSAIRLRMTRIADKGKARKAIEMTYARDKGVGGSGHWTPKRLGSQGGLQINRYQVVQHWVRRRIVRTGWFKNGVISLIVGSLAVLIVEAHSSLAYTASVETLYTVFPSLKLLIIILYWVEITLELAASGAHLWLLDKWNRLELCVLILTIPQFVPKSLIAKAVSVPQLETLLRVTMALRSLQLIRHVASWKRTLFMLSQTAQAALPCLLCLCILVYCYAACGVALFRNQYIPPTFDGSTFDNNWDAVLTMIQQLSMTGWQRAASSAMGSEDWSPRRLVKVS
jgi:hypothetical protein